MKKELLEMGINELKEEVLGNMSEFITNEAKEGLLVWFRDTLLPSIKEVADEYVSSVRSSSSNETGWSRTRDLIVIPCLVSGGLWICEKMLLKVVKQS